MRKHLIVSVKDAPCTSELFHPEFLHKAIISSNKTYLILYNTIVCHDRYVNVHIFNVHNRSNSADSISLWARQAGYSPS